MFEREEKGKRKNLRLRKKTRKRRENLRIVSLWKNLAIKTKSVIKHEKEKK